MRPEMNDDKLRVPKGKRTERRRIKHLQKERTSEPGLEHRIYGLSEPRINQLCYSDCVAKIPL